MVQPAFPMLPQTEVGEIVTMHFQRSVKVTEPWKYKITPVPLKLLFYILLPTGKNKRQPKYSN